ncbi:MAG: sigma 54-interacting transcriptional regulator [Candidatus Eisenbacteria bacterium]|nr:sigma 54-interacting transcriptional regulator [Candidatus Eisenbacteria bacterium]
MRSKPRPSPAVMADGDESARLVDRGDFFFRTESYSSALESYAQALGRLDGRGDHEARGVLLLKVARCHQARGDMQQAIECLDEAKVDLRSSRDGVQLGKLYALRATLLYELGRYTRSLRYADLAYKLLRGTGDNSAIAQLELTLGSLWIRLGDPVQSGQFYTSALSTFRRIDDKVGTAKALNNLGILHKNACEWRESIRCFAGALELAEKQALIRFGVAVRLNLGIVHFKLGDWNLAEESLKRARQIATENSFVAQLVPIDLALGNIERRRRRWSVAAELYRGALERAEANAYSRETILALEFTGELHLDREEYEAAAALLVRALARAEQIAPLGDLVNEICRRLGEARLGQEMYEEALALGQKALSSSSKINDQYERAIACRLVGLAYARLGREVEARQFIGEAIDSLTRVGESFELARTFLMAGEVGDGSETEPAEWIKRAFGIFLSLESRGYAARAAWAAAEWFVRRGRLDEGSVYLDRAMTLTTEDEEPELWSRVVRLRREVENEYADHWVRAGGGLESFQELTRLFRGSSDVNTALGEVLRLGISRSQSDRGFVALGDGGSAMKVVALQGLTLVEAESLIAKLARPIKDLSADPRPVIVSQLSGDPRFSLEERAGMPGIRSLALLPLALPSGTPGLFYADRLHDNEIGAFNQGDLNLLTLLTNLASLSVLEHQRKELLKENQSLKNQLWHQPYTEIVTQNARMIEILRMAEKVGDSGASILIEGETGTGKGLIAQSIHDQSRRRGKPFIQINCAALPEQLLESELFGHTQGAFTGAVREKTGLFKEAEGGTLFLDEVDKTTETLQAKLLHVLDKKEIRPVGSTRWTTVDTRVICATNVELKERIRSGRFLEDLYYRMNDFIIRVPPLRERPDDIALLVEHFLARFSTQYGKGDLVLLPEVHRALNEYDWRGNVRELEKTIRRLVVLSDENEPIGLSALPFDRPAVSVAAPANGAASLRDEVARTERRVINDALDRSQWNKSQASRELKISYPCLLKKIKEHGLERRSTH